MPTFVPSIKGTAFQGAIDDLQALLADGRVRREDLDVALPPESLALLEHKVLAASWYPLDTYTRIVEILVEREAQGDREGYLVERGARAAERLASTGLYRQLQATRDTWGDRVGHIMVSVAGAIYNFTTWSFAWHDADRSFTIEIREAEAFPEIARLTAQGFVQAVADRTSRDPMRVTSERAAPDRVVIRGEVRER